MHTLPSCKHEGQLESLSWQECKVDQAVGAPTTEVLYVFDEANPIDPLSLASLIQVWLYQENICSHPAVSLDLLDVHSEP